MDLYYDQLSYESYTLPYLTSHINSYKLLSNFEITIFSCNLCVAEILSPRFVSAPRFVETRWTMLRDASNKQMPRTNKTCVEPNAEFLKIQPTQYMEKTKVSSPTRKNSGICQKTGVLSSISCVFCRTMSNFGFLLSICFFWFFVHPLEVPSTVFFAILKPSAFDSMQNLVLLGSSSVVTLTWSIGSRHTLPLICWTKSPAWTKRAKRTGRFPVASARWMADHQFFGIILKRHIRPHDILQVLVLNPEIYWILYWIILEWRWRSSHCVSFVTHCRRYTFYVVHEVWGRRDASDSFFWLSGSKWETISVQDTIRVYSRQSTIIPAMIGHTCAVRHVVRLVSKKVSKFQCIPLWHVWHAMVFFLQVHNGRDFVPVVINEGMVLALNFICSFQWVLNPKLVKLNLRHVSNMEKQSFVPEALEQWEQKPWLFGLCRGLYHPAIWDL